MPTRFALLLLLLCAAAPSAALPVVGTREDLRFDRPEAWAMAFSAAALLFHGSGPAQPQEAGAFTLGAELGSIPHLSRDERRVGFNGSKLEDLNKTPVAGRLRGRIGLPGEFALELGWTPPLTLNGATPRRMFGIALERPLWRSERSRGGLRLAHQSGRVDGDISCDRATAAQPPGSPANPFGCRAPSRDRYTMRATGIELAAAWRSRQGGPEPFAALSWHRLHASTQLDAEVFTVRDRSRLSTDGDLFSASLGLRLPTLAGCEAVAALSWTPLSVRRPQRGRGDDDFWSLRLLLQRRLR